MTHQEIKPIQTYPWFAKRKNVTLFILIFFLLVSATSFFLCYKHHQSTEQQVLREDRVAIDLFALILEEHVLRIVKTMEAYANRPLLISAVRSRNAEKIREHLINLHQHNPDIDSLIVTDRTGTAWAAQPSRPDAMGKNFAYRNWYLGVSRLWKPYVSDAVLRVTGEKDTAIQIAVPVMDEGENVIGVLVNTQRAVILSQIVRRVPPEKGSTVTLTDSNGVIIYSNIYVYENVLAPYPLFESMKNLKTTGAQTVNAPDPLLGGARRYISSAKVAGIGWRIFVGRNPRTILSASTDYFILITAISLLFFLSVTFSLIYFRKRVMTKMVLDNLRAEKELLASETRFRELFDHMTSGVAIYQAVHEGEDFIISDMNMSAQRMTRVRDGFAGKSVLDVFPDVREFGLFHIFQQVWRTGAAAYHPIAQYQDADLSFWVQNYVYKLPSGQIVAVFDDVTVQKIAEERLRESEDKFKYVFDNSMVGKSITLPSGEISVNKAFSKLTGYSQEELNKKNWRDITHPDDIALTQARMGNILSGKNNSTRFTKRFIHKNGTVIWTDIASSLRRDKDGSPLYFMTSLVDITEQKIAELELLDSENRFRSLFENSLMGISAASADGHLIHANMAYARMYGYDGPAQMMADLTDIGQQLYANPEDRKEVLRILAEQGVMEPREVEAVKRDGTHFLVLVSATAVRDSNGNLLYYQATHLDITERKQAERQRESALKEIERLNAQLEQRVMERTSELAAKTADLERINKVFVDRELRMIELKARIEELEGKK